LPERAGSQLAPLQIEEKELAFARTQAKKNPPLAGVNNKAQGA